MAQVDFSLFGKVSGRCGNVIFSNYHGKTIMKAAPLHVNYPYSEKQNIQLEKFKLTQEYIRKLLPLFKAGWQEMAVGKTAVNAATSYLVKNVFTVEEGKVILDKTKVLHAKGTLFSVYDLKAKAVKSQKILYSWHDNSGNANAEAGDEFCCACSNLDNDKIVYAFSGNKREDESCLFSLPKDWKGSKVAVFGFFRNENELKVSDDQYLGTITLK